MNTKVLELIEELESKLSLKNRQIPKDSICNLLQQFYQDFEEHRTKYDMDFIEYYDSMYIGNSYDSNNQFRNMMDDYLPLLFIIHGDYILPNKLENDMKIRMKIEIKKTLFHPKYREIITYYVQQKLK